MIWDELKRRCGLERVVAYAKQAWDDLRTGFWLGLADDDVARLHVGDEARFLLWDGQALRVTGPVIAPGVTLDADGVEVRGGEGARAVRFVTAGGQPLAHLMASGDGGPWVSLTTTIPQHGHAGRVDVFVDGSLGDSVRVRLETDRAVRASGQFVIQIGNVDVFRVANGRACWAGGGFDANGVRVSRVGDAEADTDALNRRSGDARYVQAASGWSGSFGTGAGPTIAVVNGQIVGLTGDGKDATP